MKIIPFRESSYSAFIGWHNLGRAANRRELRAGRVSVNLPAGAALHENAFISVGTTVKHTVLSCFEWSGKSGTRKDQRGLVNK